MDALIESLQKLGLTSYEAKLVVALTQYGNGTASDLHLFSGIPRSAVYGVISKLEKKGIIEVQNAKPMRYHIIPPDRVIGKLKLNFEADVEYSLEQLKKIYQTQGGKKSNDTVLNVSGIVNVSDKIIRMLDSASKEIIFASSYPLLKRVIKIYPKMENIKKAIQEKIKNGVLVKITGQNESYMTEVAKDFPEAQIRVYGNENVSPSLSPSLKGGILAVDNNEILIISIKDEITPLNLTATCYNGKEQVQIFKHFMEAEWKNSISVNT